MQRKFLEVYSITVLRTEKCGKRLSTEETEILTFYYSLHEFIHLVNKYLSSTYYVPLFQALRIQYKQQHKVTELTFSHRTYVLVGRGRQYVIKYIICQVVINVRRNQVKGPKA